MTRSSQQMPTIVKDAKIACLDFNLSKFRMAVGISVQCDDIDNLSDIRQREYDITKERIKKLLDAGVNAVFSTKGIDDFAQK